MGKIVALARKPAASATAIADPAFAAIEGHRKAWADFEAVLELQQQLRSDPDTALRRAFERRYNTSLAALQHAEHVMMVDTKPTSLAGFAVLLRYVTDFENPNELDDLNKRLTNADPGACLPWHADCVLGLHLNLAEAFDLMLERTAGLVAGLEIREKDAS